MSSVYMAQVVAPMSMLWERGWHPELLVFSPAGEMIRRPLRARWNERRGLITSRGLKVTRLPSPPGRLRNLWSELPLLRLWLQRKFGKKPEVVIHCRGHAATLLALAAREQMPGLKVVFDCRGINGVEYAYVRGYAEIEQAPKPIAWAATIIERDERRAAREADYMLCVSHAMKEVVRDRWGIAGGKISVVPCCTETEATANAFESREETRRHLGLSDRFVVAYCGSLEPWQVPETCLAWFKWIVGIRTNAHLMAITTHPDRMNDFADATGIPQSSRTVLSVPQNEVAGYLAAADCGLLIREPSLVNHVASPVKFAEYLAVGVPVLISEGVGDYSKCVRTNRLGVVSSDTADRAETQRVMDQIDLLGNSRHRGKMGRRCTAFASEHLSWGRNIQTIIQAYYKSLLRG